MRFKDYLRSKSTEITATGGFYLNVTKVAESDGALRARIVEFEQEYLIV